MQQQQYYPVVFCIPMEDEEVHTDETPVCSDPTCPCHQDPLLEAWNELQSVPSYVERDLDREDLKEVA